MGDVTPGKALVGSMRVENQMTVTQTGTETVKLLEMLLAHETGEASDIERLIGLTLRDGLSRNLLGLKGDAGREQLRKRWEIFRRSFPTWFKRVVSVAGLPVEVELSTAQFWLVHMPLAEYLISRAENREGRLLVGVTGPPGCGKSTLSAILAAIVEEIAGPEGIRATVCPMDGFHYTNEYLQRTRIELPDGRAVSMMARKGAPETFDAPAALRKVRELRDSNLEVRLPEYSRLKHGPVKDAIVVPPGDHIVIVEGNYLLLKQGSWQGMSDLLDVVLFMEGNAESQKAALLDRHIAGGKTRREALKRVNDVDLVNATLLRQEKSRADIVLTVSPEHHIEKVALTKHLRHRRPA